MNVLLHYLPSILYICFVGLVIYVAITWVSVTIANLRYIRENRHLPFRRLLIWFFLPLALLMAISLYVYAWLVKPVLWIAVLLALPFLLVGVLVLLLTTLPLGLVFKKAGDYGDKVIEFIEGAPSRVIRAVSEFLDDLLRVFIWLLNHQWIIERLSHPQIRIILSLFGPPHLGEAILNAFANDPKIPPDAAAQAIAGLQQIRSLSSLMDLATNPVSYIPARIQATIALEKLGETDRAIQAWQSLGASRDGNARLRAAMRLNWYNRRDETLFIYENLVNDGGASVIARIQAAQRLAGMGKMLAMVERLRQWAKDEDPSVCLKAAEALNNLRWHADSTPLLVTIVKDHQIAEWIRLMAVRVLGTPRQGNTLTEDRFRTSQRPPRSGARSPRNGASTKASIANPGISGEPPIPAQEDALFQLAADRTLEPMFRMEAADCLDTLAQSGRLTRARDIWKLLAEQHNLPIANRITAARALFRYDESQAKIVLLSIGWDYTSGDMPRLETARALEELGWEDEARALYLALTRRGISRQVQKLAWQRIPRL
jgi:hypothetical protein